MLALWANAAAIGTTNVTDVTATITKYDARGQAIEVLEPQRKVNSTTSHNLTTSRAYNAFGEVTYEINALGARIDNSYNTMGRLIKRESPEVSITSSAGAVTNNYRPTEHYYHDASGRLVASKDANGNLTRFTLLAGTGYGGTEALVTATTTADSEVVQTGYDIHGDARKITDQIGRITSQTFDEMGRIIQLNQAGGLIQYFEYDGLAQRTKHWNNLLTSTNAEQTTYDHQGRITQRIDMGGDTTTFANGWDATIATSGMATFGGWKQVTTYANSKTLTELTDMFGRLASKTDLGSNSVGFTYDKAGRLTQRTGGNAIDYAYFNTGRLASASATVSSTTRTSSYGYDKVGNLLTEYYVNGSHVYQNATATYDALNRLKTWSEAGSSYVPVSSLSVEYDANGNVRRTNASFRSLDKNGVAASTATVHDYWYLYDSLNRVTRSEGKLVSGAIVAGYGTMDLQYDDAGQRVKQLSYFQDYYVVDPGSPMDGIPPIMGEFVNVLEERFTYDDAGRVSTVLSDRASYEDPAFVLGIYEQSASFTYDLMGRVLVQEELSYSGHLQYRREATYNAKSQVTSDTTQNYRGTIYYRTDTTYTYGSGSTYALGSPLTMTAVNYERTSPTGSWVQKKTTSTTNTFDWRDGPTQATMSYKPDTSQSTTYVSTYSYDIVGGQAQLREVDIADGRPRDVYFRNDMMGQVIRRDEVDNQSSNGDPHEIWYRFGGKQLGFAGNNGTADVDYYRSAGLRTAVFGSNAFQNGSNTHTSVGDFNQGVEHITTHNQGSSAGFYTVSTGDTLTSIAAQLWGDSSLWWKLAQANGLEGDATLIEGQELVIPVGVMRSSYTASTFTPYDPADIVGNLSPTTPKPPPKPKKACGGLGQLLLAVVAIAVTIASQGTLSGFFTGLFSGGAATASATAAAAGAIAGGAAAAAAGSIASQAVGVATGIQDKFSWNAVAMAAIGGGVGASGMGGAVAKAAGAAKGLAHTVISAMAGNAITQGIGVATGMQDKFSWAGVAAAGVGAGAFQLASSHLPGAAHGAVIKGQKVYVGATVGNRVGASAASMIADGASRSLIEGSDFGDNIMAALPNVLGQTIGNMVAGRIAGNGSTTGENSKLVQKQKVIAAASATKAEQLAMMAAGSQDAVSRPGENDAELIKAQIVLGGEDTDTAFGRPAPDEADPLLAIFAGEDSINGYIIGKGGIISRDYDARLRGADGLLRTGQITPEEQQRVIESLVADGYYDVGEMSPQESAIRGMIARLESPADLPTWQEVVQGRRDAIAAWALERVGNTDYQLSDPNSMVGGRTGQYLNGSWAPKCNIFVGDALAAAGIDVRDPSNRNVYLRTGVWGNRSAEIPGFRALGPREAPQAGDIISNGHHMGIYAPGPNGERMTVSAATPDSGFNEVVHNAWGFRPSQASDNNFVYWRYVGQRN